MTDRRSIFWFRQDLRLSDNPGLFEAAQKGSVMPIYILDDDSAGAFKMGGASRWRLRHSLESLNQSLQNALNLYVGDAQAILLKIIDENNIEAVYWNRCYEPWRIRDDAKIKALLKSKQIECRSFNGSLLWEPWEILTKDRTPYKVYTPFYRKGCLQAPAPRAPLPKPEKFVLMHDRTHAVPLDALNLCPGKWHKKMEKYWDMGEKAAQNTLFEFASHSLSRYKENRNYPCKSGTSKLSPALHFGEISPHQIWAFLQAQEPLHLGSVDIDCFLSELGWREFSYYLLYHFPELPRKNFQAKFDKFPWQYDGFLKERWEKGETGYPIVDAGMRELWQTGYMHNRVRMIAASFLVKNLLLHWHFGEDWFWDCLLDADLANNSAGWQWVAGSGADAAPYFRIFNPVIQGEKFDPDGVYTRRFVPELEKLPNQFLFKPWEAPANVLEASGVALGRTYPKPIVPLQCSRDQALQAYRAMAGGS